MKSAHYLLKVAVAIGALSTAGLAWSADTADTTPPSALPSALPNVPPAAPIRPVTDTYFGTAVIDNYRYMENLKDPVVQSWMKAQAGYTRAVLDSLPGRADLAQRVQSLVGQDLRRSNFVRRGGRLFYYTTEPGANLPKLAYRDGVDGTEHVLVDPATLATDSTRHYALDWYSPSRDGRYVAYGISVGGSEQSVLHVIEVATGRLLDEQIDRTSSSVVSWRKDNQSFFYLRYNKPGPDTPPSQTEYNARTYVHVLGQYADGDGDEAVFGRGVSASVDVPEGEGTYVLTAPDSPYAIAVANHNMDDAPNSFYVVRLDQIHGARTPWKKIAGPEDGVTSVRLHGDRLYILSQKGASRFRVLSTPAARPDLAHAQVIVPESANVISAFTLAADGIYVSKRAGSGFVLQRTAFDGHDSHPIALPYAGTVGGLTADPSHPGVMFNLQGWVKAPREIAYDPKADTATDTGLIPPSKTESDAIEATETYAVSHDGTRIPLSIISPKGVTRDGSHPTIVYGYGSYGISLDPFYSATWQAWIEHGGIIAVAHIRGGGEYGDAWHRAGQKLTKINSMLDFNAAAQYMIDQHYTQSRYLAANAASAGGIVMGGALTMDPALFRVILDDVGMSDTLRTETEPNGPPNVPEFGSTSTEDGFHALYSMSAYAHVHDGTPYPAVLFMTGANDPRVAPWHMMKMAARVQAATSSGRPALLRIDYDAGHGIGSSLSQYAAKVADEWSFALWQMGDPAFQP